MHPRTSAIACALVLAACRGNGAHRGVTVAIDSAADTIRVTVAGEVPQRAVRHLVAEVSIAPAVDDTSLFARVREFDVDARGRFWVFDDGSQSILLFGADGEFIRRIGREGAGPGEFRRNAGMVILPGDGLAEWDSRNSRISRFDSTGRYLDAMPLPGGFNTPNGIRIDDAGRLYLVRPLSAPRTGEIFGRIGLIRLGHEGHFLDSLLPPDLDVPRMRYIARHDSSTMATSSRYAPTYLWTWLRHGAFVAGDGSAYRLVIADGRGRPTVIRRELDPVPVPEAERVQEAALIRYELRRTDPGWQWDGPPLPRWKAPLVGLEADRTGRIWAQVASASVALRDEELRTPRDALDPLVHFGMPVVYEVFAPDGAFEGRIAFPPRVSFVEADGDLVWGLARDDNDLPAVTRYRITPGLGGD